MLYSYHSSAWDMTFYIVFNSIFRVVKHLATVHGMVEYGRIKIWKFNKTNVSGHHPTQGM